MNREQTYNKVIDTLNNMMPVSDSLILSEEISLRDDLGMDSLSSLTFLMELESSIDGFSVNPENLDEQHFSSIGKMVDYVISNLSA